MKDKKIIFIILAIIVIGIIIFVVTGNNKEDNSKNEVSQNEIELKVQRDENVDATNIMKEIQENIDKIKK